MSVEKPKRRTRRPGSKILLVDAHDADLARTSAALRAEGFQVVALSRAEAAVPLFSAFEPDLVILSACAPDDASIETGERLMTIAKGSLPIFYLADSRATSPSLLEAACLGRGAGIGVLPKPFDVEVLCSRVHSVLRLRDGVARRCRQLLDGSDLSLRDPLTGAWSRRYLSALVGQEIRRAERYGGGFSVVVASIEHHATFRRSYGRELSERLLVYASVVLSQAARSVDVIARVGQAEFALLLPETPGEALPAFISRLSARVRMARFELDERAVRPGLVLGTASFPEVVGAPSELLRAAFLDLRQRQSRGQFSADASGLSV